MRFISLLALIFSYLVNSFGQCVDSSLINPDAICTTLYAPVCGCNGITYSNSCVATNLGGVTSWTEGECGTLNPCKNTAQIDSTIMCPTVYEPVCGCDSITYSNSCVAQYYAGLTSWTFGPCENSINFSDSCAELSSIDFGECEMFLGYGLINGICSPIGGCGTIVNNVDYSPALAMSLADCQNNCDEINSAEPCTNLTNINFGACPMILGFGVINNSCVQLSGCSSIVDNIDYANALYSSLESCSECLSGEVQGLSYSSITLSPNPTENQLTITSFLNLDYNMYLTDIKGNVIYKNLYFKKELFLNTDALTKGVYFLNLIDLQSNKSFILKFIKI